MKKNIFLSLEFDNMNPIQKIEMLSSDLNTQILDEIIIILHALNEEFTTFDYYGIADQQFRFSLIINSDTLDQSFRLG